MVDTVNLEQLRQLIDKTKSKINQDLDELSSRINGLIQEADQVNADIRELNDQISSLDAAIANLETQLRIARDDKSSRESRIKNLEKRLDALRKKKQESEAEKATETQEIARLATEIREAETELDSLKKELEQAKSELEEARASFDEKLQQAKSKLQVEQANRQQIVEKFPIVNYLVTKGHLDLPEAEIISLLSLNPDGLTEEEIKSKAKTASAVLIFRTIKKLEADNLIVDHNGKLVLSSDLISNLS